MHVSGMMISDINVIKKYWQTRVALGKFTHPPLNELKDILLYIICTKYIDYIKVQSLNMYVGAEDRDL